MRLINPTLAYPEMCQAVPNRRTVKPLNHNDYFEALQKTQWLKWVRTYGILAILFGRA
jgi:hypothetical protein